MNSNNDRVAERLQELNHFLQEKNRRLEALVQLFAQHPTLPIEAMVREYSAALDEVGICAPPEEGDDQSLGHRQRSGITKRHRNREKLISAGVEMILSGRTTEAYFARTIARAADVTDKTVYHHFGTKNGLLVAAYDRLLQPILSEATEGN